MIERACRITQVNRPEHLIESHCKPWRDCESNDERLDGENGLLLTPTVDYLFERRSADLSGGPPGVPEADGDSTGREAECGGVLGGAAAVPGVSPGSGVSGGEGAAIVGRRGFARGTPAKSGCLWHLSVQQLMPASVILAHLSLAPVMNYLYSLYDALVSISVPSDKARAVVDAMERDMSTALATKQDLLLLKQEMASLRTELKQVIESRHTLLDQKIDTLRGDMTRDMAALDLRLTVKLGSMLFVGFGLTIAAMRLWV